MCSDSSSDSEPESSEPTSPDQVVAAEQPALPPLPPPPEAIVVHPTTPAADHMAEHPDSSCAPTRRSERNRQRPRWQNDDWIGDIDLCHFDTYACCCWTSC